MKLILSLSCVIAVQAQSDYYDSGRVAQREEVVDVDQMTADS